jgi:hypothetical protein
MPSALTEREPALEGAQATSVNHNRNHNHNGGEREYPKPRFSDLFSNRQVQGKPGLRGFVFCMRALFAACHGWRMLLFDLDKCVAGVKCLANLYLQLFWNFCEPYQLCASILQRCMLSFLIAQQRGLSVSLLAAHGSTSSKSAQRTPLVVLHL